MSPEFTQHDWSAAVEDDLRQIVRLAAREDLDRFGDWTTVALIGAEEQGRAVVVAREAGVIAGLRAAPALFDEMQAAVEWRALASDGDDVPAGASIAELSGSARDVLIDERPLLNLLGRLSGIATLTRRFVRAIDGTGARICDTRKTTPGWRRLEKYAVKCGGGANHRTGLFDAALIKDNHLMHTAAKNVSPADAVRQVREFLEQTADQRDGRSLPIEIEIDQLEQLEAVLAADPDIVLLDNMPPATLRLAVEIRNRLAPTVALDASGGVNLQTVRAIAESGVDQISVGELTHSAPNLDIALDWQTGSAR